MSLNRDIGEALARDHALGLTAVANRARRDLRPSWREHVAALVASLERARLEEIANPANQRRALEAWEREARAQWARYTTAVVGQQERALGAVVEQEAQHTRDVIAAALGTVAGLRSAPAARRRDALRTARLELVPGQRAPLRDWWRGWRMRGVEATTRAVARAASAPGASASSVRRALTTRGGVLDQALRGADTLLEGGTLGAGNLGRQLTYEANGDGGVVHGVEWSAVLDARLCPRCASLSGGQWHPGTGQPLRGSPIRVPYPGPPPLHRKCRCAVLPVLHAAEDLPAATREAMSAQARREADGDAVGPLAGEEWLRRMDARSPRVVDAVLGATRAALWRRRGLELRTFVATDGHVRTLADLAQAQGISVEEMRALREEQAA